MKRKTSEPKASSSNETTCGQSSTVIKPKQSFGETRPHVTGASNSSSSGAKANEAKGTKATDEDIDQVHEAPILIPARANIATLREHLMKAFHSGKIADAGDLDVYDKNHELERIRKVKNTAETTNHN